jgi:K+-transporting ATPase A subunit
VTITGWLQIALFAAIIGVITRPLGGYLARVYAGERTLLRPLLQPVEVALYRVGGIKPDAEQTWYRYAVSFLLFHAFGIHSALCAAAAAVLFAAKPSDACGCLSGSGAEYSGQFRDQHELAIL